MIPRRGSRRIEVDGASYRWRLRRRPTARMRQGAPLVVAISRDDVRGQTLLLTPGGLHAHNDCDQYGVSIRPAQVAAWIRGAIGAGWRPDHPGPPFSTRSLSGAIPGRASPRGQGPLTREHALALATASRRDPCAWEAGMLFIDGISFLERVRAAEQPHIERERAARGSGPGAGDYLPRVLTLSAPLTEDSHGFVLEADDPVRKKAALLGCTCGITECWFLLADIWWLEDVVVWANFEQFHRSWIYNLGPFVFERDAYERLS